MTDPTTQLYLALTALAAVAMISGAGLKGFSAWLALKHAELTLLRGEAPGKAAGSRIEVADLKERIRKLEAIASGVEL